MKRAVAAAGAAATATAAAGPGRRRRASVGRGASPSKERDRFLLCVAYQNKILMCYLYEGYVEFTCGLRYMSDLHMNCLARLTSG